MLSSTLLLLLGIGAVTGVTTVLFGFGGGFVTVPAVYLVAGRDHADAMHVAVATSTAVMIVNASIATIVSARRRRLPTEFLWPITIFIGIGAVLGAYLATCTSEALLHWLYVAYIAVTIVDCVVRRGFVSRQDDHVRPLGGAQSVVVGVVVGVVASFLGVGGSVMTVPMMRRRGLDMASATALANPLSLPAAIGATAVYVLLSRSATSSFGAVDATSSVALLAGSLPAIAVTRSLSASRRVPDSTHAVMYLALLVVVLVGMILLR